MKSGLLQEARQSAANSMGGRVIGDRSLKTRHSAIEEHEMSLVKS
jgi:hypothetical protein